jgi:uncharacterized protein DUF4266
MMPTEIETFTNSPSPLRERARGEGGMRRVAIVLVIVTLLSGCATEPWVKPYEREWLADPLMSFSRDPLSDKYMQHVYDVREAARGAGVAQGGGCGCN